MDDSIIKRMVQIGVVSAVQGTTARVIFRGSGMTSGWLSVLQHNGAEIEMKQAGDPAHIHNANVTTWMPKINDVVLVLYPAVQGSDGYILGRIP